MFKKYIKEYIEINKREILVVIILLLLGIIIGIGVYTFSSSTIKNVAVSSAKEVLNISKTEMYLKTNIMANGIKTNIMLVMFLGLLSVTLIGKWLIYLLVIIKGFALSFYSAILFSIFGPWWGMLTVFLIVVLVNIIYLPAFIYLIISFLDVNFNIFKVRINNPQTVKTYKIIFILLFCFAIIFSSLVVENIMSSIILNIYSKI